MPQIYRDNDATLEILKNKKIVLFGYGTQGRAQGLNLKESGLNVTVCLKPESATISQARSDGFDLFTDPKQAARSADLVMLLTPDEIQKAIWEEHLKENMKKGAVLGFAHGFSLHFRRIVPREDLDCLLLSPKAVGDKVRSLYQEGHGPICLLAVHQDATGNAKEIALAYAKGIGGTRTGVIETTVEEETVTNIFGEQAVLCGGISALMKAGFETLVKRGYQPEVAYFETVHEVKLLVDLIYQKGIAGMREAISNTAEYGDYTRGPRVIGEAARQEMEKILDEIETGKFTEEYIAEFEKGYPQTRKFREEKKFDLIEKVGERIRSLLPIGDQP